MVVIPGPVEFLMGSPETEKGREAGPKGDVEPQHPMRIDRSYAIAAKEVTLEQFRRFRQDYACVEQYTPSALCPVPLVTWYEAVAYCNWLSKEEGIPKEEWCYLENAEGKYAEGMKLAPDYLKRIGYRLPSEAEWEYACRAGALTSRYYGETDELLDKYEWSTRNSLDRATPGSYLKPNDFGLFDMLGNAHEWCQNHIKFDAPDQDKEDPPDVRNDDSRVLRGGSFFYPAWTARCAFRARFVPTSHNYDVSFRLVRTFR
jgi:formylglycine-generating enzyme required for sulfatase activity